MTLYKGKTMVEQIPLVEVSREEYVKRSRKLDVMNGQERLTETCNRVVLDVYVDGVLTTRAVSVKGITKLYYYLKPEQGNV